MLGELRRIFEADILSSAMMSWENYSPKIVKQARMERGARVTKAVSELMEDENGKCDYSMHALTISACTLHAIWCVRTV